MVAISHAVLFGMVASFSALVSADNCKPRLFYCGTTLLRKGNYYDQIEGALKASGQSTNDAHIHNGLFYCTGGPNGEITFQAFCGNGCVDGGNGKSDHC
ncbi:hypothetical protein GE21DRAFT_10657 [Neurospora crassa]|uniref:Uncharacterized protein n=2 Tax=Neurospora TaxID=5140 RepID=Q7S5Q5_NEUCR|nr:hypothetical protein NCU05788 [Neurospora crassa OR74A]EAA30812.1 hypothetical protein NCU05788 [Neurospora crassa OR74A]KHE86628.1 hypothetical protein GE21DRAFT_10657 [Neurospora crassa]|eukprot:XP_960048.1 hypothetical protein NCU05788 [Neurospora crassa OR74A]